MRLLLLTVGAMAAGSPATGSTLTLAWDPTPDSSVAGYLVYVGAAPGSYTEAHDVGGLTTFTLLEARPGQQYCFAVAAYATGPLVGPPSGAVCGYSDRPPVLTNPGTLTSQLGVAATLQLHGADPDGRAVSYAAAGLPPGMTLTASTGFISGVPAAAGTFAVVATVHDGVLSTSQGFTWIVEAPADIPAPVPADDDVPPVHEPDDSLVPDAGPLPIEDPPVVPGPDDSDAPDRQPDAVPPVDESDPPTSDGGPLVITRLERGPGASTVAAILLIGGTTDPAAGITAVEWSNAQRRGRADGTTTWTARIPLFRGVNSIRISARNAQGQVYSQTVLIVRD